MMRDEMAQGWWCWRTSGNVDLLSVPAPTLKSFGLDFTASRNTSRVPLECLALRTALVRDVTLFSAAARTEISVGALDSSVTQSVVICCTVPSRTLEAVPPARAREHNVSCSGERATLPTRNSLSSRTRVAAVRSTRSKTEEHSRPPHQAVLLCPPCIHAPGSTSSGRVVATATAWPTLMQASASRNISSFRNVAGGSTLKQRTPASLSSGCLGASSISSNQLYGSNHSTVLPRSLSWPLIGLKNL
jgi:hypothetical protein